MDAITPARFVELLHRIAARVAAAEDRLSELDRATGDGDHGFTMARGWQAAIAAVDALPPPPGFQPICNAAAKAFMNSVGGSAGPLYATILMRGGAAVKDRSALDLDGITVFLDAACQGIRDRGKAQAGDKTMLDAWLPAIEALHAARGAGRPLDQALAETAAAAERGAEATAAMMARLGRASRLGERSRGHVDPGAASSAILFRALAE